MKPRLNIRQIEAFRAVMLSGSVVGAAKLLNVTQPGVSRTISHLELHLGYALFERRGRRIYPTAEAEALYREVERLYVGIDQIGQAAMDIRLHRAGTLRVATLSALSQWLVPQVVTQFLQERPKVSLFVQTLASRQIAELVATRQLDLGVVELPLTKPGVRFQALPPVPLVAVMPSSHRLAERYAISMQDLHNERMILLSQHSYVRYKIDDVFSSHGVTPHVVVETQTSAMAYALAAAGAGVTLLSRWTAQSPVDDGLKVVPIRESVVSQYAVVFPDEPSPMVLAEEFAQTLMARIEAGAL